MSRRLCQRFTMNKWIIFGLLAVLIVPISEARHEPFSRTLDEDFDVWIVEVAKTSPPLVPAIALEHRSDARINTYLSFTPLSEFTGLDYTILDVNVKRVSRTEGVRGTNPYYKICSRHDKTGRTKPCDDSTAEGTLGSIFGVEEAGFVGINLDYYGSYRLQEAPEAKEDDVQSICAGLANTNGTFVDKVPDEITVELEAIIKFTAEKANSEGEKEKVPASYFTSPNSFGGTQQLLDEDLANWERKWEEDHVEELSGPDYRNKLDEARNKEKDRLNAHYGVGKVITDRVKLNFSVGVDKTRIWNPTPEQLRKQICLTIGLRDKLDSIIKPVSAINDYAQTACLGSFVAATAGILTGTTPVCDAIDVRSLGCDWVMCPSNKCSKGLDPRGSLVASSVMCWDNRHFFGKDPSPKIIYDRDWDEKKNAYTLTETTKEGSFECTYPGANRDNPLGDPSKVSESVPIPTYACISGVEGHLKAIDGLIEEYQDCLVAAHTTGVSVGLCDTMRSVFLCEQIVENVLSLSQSGGVQDWIKGSVDHLLNDVPGSPTSVNDDKNELEERLKEVTAFSKDTAETYQNVPFFTLMNKQRQYQTSTICSLFVQGKLFNLKDLKEGMFKAKIPDSYFVVTNKQPWAYEGEGDKIVSYSYDVFFSIYSSEIETRKNDYSVWLEGFSIDEKGEVQEGKDCTIRIDSGRIKEGKIVQKNGFKVDRCDARKQCIQVKGIKNCNQIGVPLRADFGYDPLGISTLWKKPDDADDDGLPDTWEESFGVTDALGDDDGDGYCNAVEFEFGTEPTDPTPKGSPNDKGKHKNNIEECKNIRDILKERYKEGLYIGKGILQEDASEEDRTSFTPPTKGDSSKSCLVQNPDYSLCISEEERCDGNLVDSSDDPTRSMCCDGECIEDLDQTSLSLQSFTINGKEDYVEKGGIYDVSLKFDQDIDLCRVFIASKEYASTVDPVNKKICTIKTIPIFGDSVDFIITAEPLDDMSYTRYSGTKKVTNKEQKVDATNALLCTAIEIVNPSYFCLVPEDNVNQRCSDYGFGITTNNPKIAEMSLRVGKGFSPTAKENCLKLCSDNNGCMSWDGINTYTPTTKLVSDNRLEKSWDFN